MKNILDYLYSYNESLYETNENALVIFESYEIKRATDLQEVYEALFDKMFIVEEGFFSKIGSALSKIGSSAEKLDAKIEDKKKQLSDAAKKAIETAKKKAGDAWGNVKDAYTNTVAQIDSAIQDTVGTVKDIVKQTGLKADEIVAKIATVTTNALAQGKETLAKAFAEKSKMASINIFLAGTISCLKNGLTADDLMNLMTAAGVK